MCTDLPPAKRRATTTHSACCSVLERCPLSVRVAPLLIALARAQTAQDTHATAVLKELVAPAAETGRRNGPLQLDWSQGVEHWPLALLHAMVLAHRATGRVAASTVLLDVAAHIAHRRKDIAPLWRCVARWMESPDRLRAPGVDPLLRSLMPRSRTNPATVRMATRALFVYMAKVVGPLLAPVLFDCVMGYHAGPQAQRFGAALAGAALADVAGQGDERRAVCAVLFRGMLYCVLGGSVLACTLPPRGKKRNRNRVGS